MTLTRGPASGRHARTGARHVAKARVSPARGQPLQDASRIETARLFETRCMPHRRLDAISSRQDEIGTASRRDGALTPIIVIICLLELVIFSGDQLLFY